MIVSSSRLRSCVFVDPPNDMVIVPKGGHRPLEYEGSEEAIRGFYARIFGQESFFISGWFRVSQNQKQTIVPLGIRFCD